MRKEAGGARVHPEVVRADTTGAPGAEARAEGRGRRRRRLGVGRRDAIHGGRLSAFRGRSGRMSGITVDRPPRA